MQPILFPKYTPQAQPQVFIFFCHFSHSFLKFPILQDQKCKILTLNILIEKILVEVVDTHLSNISEDFRAIELKLVKNIAQPVAQIGEISRKNNITNINSVQVNTEIFAFYWKKVKK